MCLCGVGAAAHPDELDDRLTLAQKLEWMAMYRLRPFGTKRDDMRSGLQSFWHVTTHVAELPDDHSPEKYMLTFEDAPEPDEVSELFASIRSRLSG